MPQKPELKPAFEGIAFLTVKSRHLRGRADISFFVPPQAKRLHHQPLVILLHGAHGSHWNWAVNGGAHRVALRLIEQNVIPPVVLAMPSDGLWGDGSGYLRHQNHDFEKWIVEDVPATTRQAVPCVSERSPLFLAGLSMGGFGALRIGAKYPGFTRGISAHSAITHFDQMMKYVEEDPASYGAPVEDVSVLATMLRNRDRLPAFRFDCGVKDPLAKYNRQLHHDLEAHGIPHHYDEFPGGHEWTYWAAHIEDSLRFFGKILSGEKPA